jgi:hypothetical protein
VPHPGDATWSVKHHLLVDKSQSGLTEHPAAIDVAAPGAVKAVFVTTQLQPESLKIVPETEVKTLSDTARNRIILIRAKANIYNSIRSRRSL